MLETEKLKMRLFITTAVKTSNPTGKLVYFKNATCKFNMGMDQDGY
jgi:hypothetical protein